MRNWPTAAGKATLFARLSPAHKQRVIKILQGAGHVVGFLGDGINDAPALRAADVGISVDTAVDIAKESADVILLEKDLLVLEEGVREGRKVFANILKYIRMGASSNFGNMFSVLGASVFLPFVPMAPLQILTNNLLYDFSQVPIPDGRRGPGTDRQAAAVVDERHHPVHPVHRPVQLGLRLHHLFHHALRLRLLGPGQRVALPDRLVRRVAADADADHPRHPHEPDSVPPEPGELAADRDHGRGHARRRLVAVFAHRPGVRLHPVAAALLAPPRCDAARLCPADPGGEDLALSEGLGVRVAGRDPPQNRGGPFPPTGAAVTLDQFPQRLTRGPASRQAEASVRGPIRRCRSACEPGQAVRDDTSSLAINPATGRLRHWHPCSLHAGCHQLEFGDSEHTDLESAARDGVEIIGSTALRRRLWPQLLPQSGRLPKAFPPLHVGQLQQSPLAPLN